MKQFLIALQFLTILPIKIKSEIKEKEFGKSLIFFPVVGVMIGMVLASGLFIFGFLPYLVTISLILVISVIITGGIHLDGFADTCDGFYGAKPKEEALKIMRDSRIGTMGVIGVVCLLLFEFTILINISKEILWKSLIVMAAFARWSQVLACYTSTYSREEGKAKYFIEYNGKREFLVASFLTLTLFLSLMKLGGLILFALSLFPILLFISYVKRRIGGMTGDTIGATSEIAEVSILFFTLICLRYNVFINLLQD